MSRIDRSGAPVYSLDRTFWNPRVLAPIPALADLREQVLLRSTRRCPKWKFRLGPDLVVQLQPKPAVLIADAARAYGVQQSVLEFNGHAVMSANCPPDAFAAGKSKGMPSMRFRVYAEAGDQHWLLKPQSVCTSYRDRLTNAWVRVNPFDVVDRVLAALTSTAFVNLPAITLVPQCLICGKALTDPASMARAIGPECYGSSTLMVPGIHRAPAGGHNTLHFDEKDGSHEAN